MSDLEKSDLEKPDLEKSDFQTGIQHDIHAARAAPRCPLCGGATALKQERNAVRTSLDVYRCTACNVNYPVVKKRAESDARGDGAGSDTAK